MSEEVIELKPPYLPWTTFVNVTDELRGKGLPAQLDRSAIQGKSGSTQSHYLAALRFLGLIDGEDRPTERFKQYVNEPDKRKDLMEEILRDKYSDALALGTSSTSNRLTQQFRDYGVEGATGRKAIAFFLNAARYAELELSPYWPQTRPGAGGRRKSGTATTRQRKRTTRQAPPENNGAGAISGTDPKEQYIALLLRKAEESDMDPDLLDRIERVIGVSHQEAQEPELDEDKS